MVSAWWLAALWLGQTQAPVVGQVVQLAGQAAVVHGHESQDVAPLNYGDEVHASDKVVTQGNSWVRILFDEESVIDLAPDSAFSIELYRRQSADRVTMRLRAINGRLWAHVKPRDEGEPDVAIATPQAVANVRGTSFIVDTVDSEATTITGVTGHVTLYPNQLLGDALPAEVYGRQTATVQGTTWPPQIAQASTESLQELREALTPPPVLDPHEQPERMGRLEEMRQGTGAVAAKPGLLLQVLPSPQPTVVPMPLNLDPGARTGKINATVRIND